MPTRYQVTEQNVDLETKAVNCPFFRHSIIYDTSLLIPDQQKIFVDKVLRNLWDSRVNNPSNQWTLVALEEFELFGRNIRGSVGQNLFRIMHAGRNQRIRVLAITTDLALIDANFITGATIKEKAVTIEEAELDLKERNWLSYFAGACARAGSPATFPIFSTST